MEKPRKDIGKAESLSENFGALGLNVSMAKAKNLAESRCRMPYVKKHKQMIRYRYSISTTPQTWSSRSQKVYSPKADFVLNCILFSTD